MRRAQAGSCSRALFPQRCSDRLGRTSAGKECLPFLLGSYSPLFPPVPWVDSHPSSSSFISLDKLLDAGLYTGEVTEIVGGPGSGKTQVHVRPAARRTGGGGCIAPYP